MWPVSARDALSVCVLVDVATEWDQQGIRVRCEVFPISFSLSLLASRPLIFACSLFSSPFASLFPYTGWFFKYMEVGWPLSVFCFCQGIMTLTTENTNKCLYVKISLSSPVFMCFLCWKHQIQYLLVVLELYMCNQLVWYTETALANLKVDMVSYLKCLCTSICEPKIVYLFFINTCLLAIVCVCTCVFLVLAWFRVCILCTSHVVGEIPWQEQRFVLGAFQLTSRPGMTERGPKVND